MPIEYTIDQIENRTNYDDAMLIPLQCIVCLNMAKDAVQCEECETLYCNECQIVCELTGKNCATGCKSNRFEKANKFAREMLETLSFRCVHCDQGKIEYSSFESHLKDCKKDDEAYTKSSIIKRLEEVGKEIELLKKSKGPQINVTTNLSSLEIRQKLLTSSCASKVKMQLYNDVMNGNLQDLKSLIESENISIFEEISAPNYFWTILHYSFYYGKIQLIQYMLNLLKTKNLLELGLKLETNDGRTPLLCLLRSNSMNNDVKKTALTNLFGYMKIPLSETEIKEIRQRNMTNILDNFGYR